MENLIYHFVLKILYNLRVSLSYNSCEFHIRMNTLTQVKADCLPPDLHVAPMGSVLVVYTLKLVTLF